MQGLLAAKTATHSRFDDADFADWQIKRLRDDAPDVIGSLRRRVDDEAVQVIKAGIRSVRFEHRMSLSLRVKCFVDYDIALGKRRFDIANVHVIGGGDIFLRFKADGKHLINAIFRMNNAFVFKGGFKIEDRFKNFIFDFN
jgi:hypothetical protein